MLLVGETSVDPDLSPAADVSRARELTRADHEGGVHRLLAFLVVPLEEGVEVGGIRCSTRAALDKLVPSSRAPVAPSPIGVKDRRGQARARGGGGGRRGPAAGTRGSRWATPGGAPRGATARAP